MQCGSLAEPLHSARNAKRWRTRTERSRSSLSCGETENRALRKAGRDRSITTRRKNNLCGNGQTNCLEQIYRYPVFSLTHPIYIKRQLFYFLIKFLINIHVRPRN
jgi:hypothetical protein